MKGLVIEEKQIVVPGETLATGMDYLPGIGTKREGDKIIATKIGMVILEGRAIKLVPLAGKYVPKRGDTIIAKVTDVTLNGWRLETNSAYSAMLNMKDATSQFIQRGADLTHYFNFGDYVISKIVNVTTQKLVDLTMKGPGLRKLGPGRILKVTPNKVPRIIGKQGSMVSMIKEATGCNIIIGQNGMIWLKGDNPQKELLAVGTIKMIEENAHRSGLTDSIKTYLQEKTKR